MGHIAQHFTKIVDRISLPINQVDRGMIAEIVYKSATQDQTKRSLYLVLDMDGTYMHVLDLNEISIRELHKLLQYTSSKNPELLTIKANDFSKINFNKDSKDLYDSVIKNSIYTKGYKKLLTRKHDGAGIQLLKIVEYKWDDKLFPR